MYSSISFAGPQPFNDWFAVDTTQRHVLGLYVDAVDPFWGWGEFVYVKASGTIAKGLVCIIDDSFNIVGVPNAANQGFPVCVAMTQMATLTFGWVMKSGFAVYATNATVAADTAMGITGVGTLGANTAGKQILGLRNRIAATGTKAITNVQTTNNSGVLLTKGFDGWFLGMALSGTGIPASTVVAKLDPDGRRVYMGSVIGTLDKVATATGSVTVTGTYTGFGGGIIDAPFAQGAIT
jgi:hypothetical protein